MSLLSSSGGSLESKQQRDMPVIPEILAVVEELKKHMLEQKKIRDEFNNASNKPLENLNSELSELQHAVMGILSCLRRQNVQAAHMSEEVLKLESNSGMIQRTLDTTYNCIQEMPELTEYFTTCLSSFGNRVQTYKQEVQAIEDLLSSRAKIFLTPKELAEVLRKLDDQFMSLAAQLYTVNEEISSAKAQFLKKYRTSDGEKTCFSLSDNENQFASTRFDLLEKNFTKPSNLEKTPYGPSPFALTAMTAKPSVSVSPAAIGQTVPLTFNQPGLPALTLAPGAATSFAGIFSKPTASNTLGTALAPTSQASGGFNFANPSASTAAPGIGLGFLNTSASTSFGTPGSIFSLSK